MRTLFFSAFLIAASALPAAASPLSDVQHSMANFAALKSYHSTMTMNNMVFDTDMQTPNRLHIKTQMFEMIMLPDASYMKQNGTWTKMPGGMSGDTVNQLSKLTKANSSDFTVTDLGMRVFDGQPVHAYRCQSTKTDKPFTLEVNGQGLPVHMEFGSGKDAGEITISRFNAPVSINAPI